jgi:hypothetical protein
MPTVKETRDQHVHITACAKWKDYSSTALGCYLQIAASASVYNVMLVFGIGHANVSKSLWVVTEAINQCKAFDITYPTCPLSMSPHPLPAFLPIHN